MKYMILTFNTKLFLNFNTKLFLYLRQTMPFQEVNSLKMIEKAAAISCENNIYIQIRKMTEHALTPTRESPRSAGFDYLSPYDTTVPPKGKE